MYLLVGLATVVITLFIIGFGHVVFEARSLGYFAWSNPKTWRLPKDELFVEFLPCPRSASFEKRVNDWVKEAKWRTRWNPTITSSGASGLFKLSLYDEKAVAEERRIKACEELVRTLYSANICMNGCRYLLAEFYWAHCKIGSLTAPAIQLRILDSVADRDLVPRIEFKYRLKHVHQEIDAVITEHFEDETIELIRMAVLEQYNSDGICSLASSEKLAHATTPEEIEELKAWVDAFLDNTQRQRQATLGA